MDLKRALEMEEIALFLLVVGEGVAFKLKGGDIAPGRSGEVICYHLLTTFKRLRC